MSHVVAVQIAGEVIDGWIEYSINSSLTAPADSFSMSRPFSLEVFKLCKPDNEVTVTIDGTKILRGFIDDRLKSSRAGTIEITGRDRSGRLVQESAPQVEYNGLTLTKVIAKLADPWFTKVSTSNARNRRVRRGKGRKSSAANEPLFLDEISSRRIDPGQMRWAVIEELATQAGYLVWSSSDGTELIVGTPNYAQEPDWYLYHAEEGSESTSTVLDMDVIDSVGDRYSQITVLGAGAGSADNYGANVTKRSGTAQNSTKPWGVGKDFAHPKRLVLPNDSVRSSKQARQQAGREMARRDASGHRLSVVAAGHGQLVGGVFPTLFAPDTTAHCVDEETNTHGIYLITSCQYTSSRTNGEQTRIELVPKGTELAP